MGSVHCLEDGAAPAQWSVTGNANAVNIGHFAPSLFSIERLVGQLVGELFGLDVVRHFHLGHVVLLVRG
jgi:hypothetical protein